MKRNIFLTILATLVLLGYNSGLYAQSEYKYNSEFTGYPYSGTACYPDGCVDYSTWAAKKVRANVYQSAYDYLQAVSVALNMNHKDNNRGWKKDAQGRYIGLSCFNSLIAKLVGCSNGATNEPSCNICPSGKVMTNGQCVCNNGATGSSCNICPSGQVMQNNLCVCANGATNPTACNTCPAGSNMVNGTCSCNNGADVFQQCNTCKSGQVFDATGQCKDGCSTTNACGQTITGFMNNGKCELSTAGGTDPNASCIVNFNVTTNTVNPNGSVEFSWAIANLPNGISSKCGFVDLTTATPRPIPGLQNLDPNTDRARINNVQRTTRFCLVCQFYNLLNNNALLGEAVKHQWVRVIKVGEN